MTAARVNQSRIAALALLLAACGAASGMSLVEAFERARIHDPVYRAAFHAGQAGREERVIGRAALLPSVAANYAGSRNRTDITEGLKTTHPAYTSRAAGVSLRQALFNLDAWARYRQGQAQSEGSEAQFEAAGQALIVRVAGAYIDALYSDEQAALAQASRDTLLEQNKVNARLFDKGEGTRTDMLETQARLDLAEAKLLEAADAQRAARATLGAMTGAEVSGLDRLAGEVAIRAQDRAGFDSWRAQALAANAELRAQAAGVEVARAGVLRARAAHMPRLELVASYAKNDSDTINTLGQESTVRSIGVQLNVPLYSGGAASAGTRQAQANALRASAELDDKTGKLLLALRKDYDEVAGSVARIEALQRAVASAALLVHATGQSIKGGVRINLDLLSAQEQLSTARRDLALARYSYLLASLRLRAGAGTLSADDVREIGANFR